jgi:hypothetical protein
LLGQFGVTARQFLEPGVARDGMGDERQFLRADALAVVFALFMALEQGVGALGQEAPGALALVSLLAQMAPDHGIDTGHLLEDLRPFMLEGGCEHIV